MPNPHNAERLKQAIQDEIVYDEPFEFNVRTWNCGSIMCIGGTACLLYVGEQPDGHYHGDYARLDDLDSEEIACGFLGITREMGEALFYPKTQAEDEYRIPFWTSITKDQACAAIDLAIDPASTPADLDTYWKKLDKEFNDNV